ncbi:MAG TPA: tryptophan synthase subunit alpha [Saprospiraceae bacterium]|nr:tryptophan synthase subunit alpha [Saprospiraceae bacterium]HMP13405.1 tryptophan synthase subunit alpha [Saprospiraceae bacterium]
MNRIQQLFQKKKENILNIYFTAGFPRLHDTEDIILALEKGGVDLIEIGMPYSDPLADGPTIQQSGEVALANGMTLELLFQQIVAVRAKTEIPLVLMGYFNQVMQYGEERFFRKCAEVGIDGLILPDMPLHVYEEQYQDLFSELNLSISFLITPQTPEARIRKIDALSRGFIYMVSSASITGAKDGISEAQLAYFNRINNMQLKNPRLIGFGISNYDTFITACKYASGAIIGSAFIRALSETPSDAPATTIKFVQAIRGLVPA